jgi:hypothetical protein
VDSQGQVYIISATGAKATDEVIRELGPEGVLNFPPQPTGAAGSPLTVLVTNTGNESMALTREFIGGPNAGEFSIDPDTTTCMLTSGATLGIGQICGIGVIFTPHGAGTRTAKLVLLDNTVAGADSVILNGTGALSTPTAKIASPAAGQSFASGASIVFKASVAGVSGAPAPTGKVQFSVDGVSKGSPVALSSGVASTTLTGLKAGAHKLAFTYSGDANYHSAGPISESITVKAAAAATSRVTLAKVLGSDRSCSAAEFVVAVTARTAALPTGKVELLDGARVLASGTLTKGKATLKANLSGIRKAVLVARYTGDGRHLPANSAGLQVATSGSDPCKVK